MPNRFRRLPHRTSPLTQHVNIPKHQEALRKSEFSPSISELCRLFNSEEVQETPKRTPKKQARKIKKADKPSKLRKEL
jgi:hypothetical protein